MYRLKWELQIEGNGILDLDECEYIADKLIDKCKKDHIVIDKDSPFIIHGEIHQGGDVDEILAEHNKETK